MRQMNNQYQICDKCIMDTTDPDITFDAKGVCNYCNDYENIISKKWHRGAEGKEKLEKLVAEIKNYSKGKEYDCIIGLSGGVDSSYLAFLGTQLGLRMLAVHVDAGWNSELAVQNIQNICTTLNIDLVTEVIDWSVMRKLQLAFLKSGLVNQDIPQDHAFFAALYNYAKKNNIKHVLNGINISTENTLPVAWKGSSAMDDATVKSVYKKFNKESLKKFPLINYWYFSYVNTFLKRFVVVDLLNYIDYSKSEALKILAEKVNYKDYGGKHNESRFTKFHQNYFLIKKFGFEKRRAHLASMVISGLKTRDEALLEIKVPLYKDKQSEEDDKEYVAKKLGISVLELDEIIAQPPYPLSAFKNNHLRQKKLQPILSFFGKTLKLFKR
jgi:N-acetyl sugar amidotransferase